MTSDCMLIASECAPPQVEPFKHTSLGLGLLLSTSTERCVQLSAVSPPPSQGVTRLAVKIAGRALFAPSALEALVKDGVKFIGLDGEVATAGPVAESAELALLSEVHFPSIMHMSSALELEEGLAALAGALPALRAPPGDPRHVYQSKVTSAITKPLSAFAQHTFFCFNASKDPNSILPITALHDGASFMLLYTCEIILEQARKVLDDLGAFQSTGLVPSGPFPATYLVPALTTEGTSHAGIHINEFVPGIDDGYKLVGLQKTDVVRLMEAASGVAV
jgi:hypothetical protein